jgi:hypothetical protein
MPPEAGMPDPGYGQGYLPPQTSTEERIEEIAEAIIDEKWNELVKVRNIKAN